MSNESQTDSAETAMAIRLRELFTDKQVQKQMVETIVHNKPIGWSRRSQATYYAEKYGLQIKKVLDGMMVDGKEFCFGYKAFEEKFGLGKDSLYLRIYQSKRYLLEKLDPDNVYARFLEKINVRRERGKGVVFRFKPEYQNGEDQDFVPVEVLPESEEPKWKKKMMAWLESDETAPFSQTNIVLSPEDIATIEVQLNSLGDRIMSSVTAHSIKLIKRNV